MSRQATRLEHGKSRPRAGLPPAKAARGGTPLRGLALLTLLLAVPAAHGVMTGSGWESKASLNPDLAAGAAAVENGQWDEAIAILTGVVGQRPWDDDAYTLLGFAYRKRGDYPLSFRNYRRALELNPHHRGALEYMGEAYLETGRPDEARALLARIEAACRRALGDDAWKDGCEEWRELAEKITAAQ